MTYEIEILEPKAKKLLEELAHLKLIRFITQSNRVVKKVNKPTKEEIIAGITESVQAINADLHGEKALPDIWDALNEIDEEIGFTK